MTEKNGITKIRLDCRLRTTIQELAALKITHYADQTLVPDTSWVILLQKYTVLLTLSIPYSTWLIFRLFNEHATSEYFL